MNTRSNNTLIKRITTRRAFTGTFKKSKDSDSDIEKIKKKSLEILTHEKKVIVSIVWPNSRYKNIRDNESNIHEGHTLSMTYDTGTLIIYDNTCQEKYNIENKASLNYKNVINYIINNINGFKSIYFYKTNYEKYKNILNKSEGSCSNYIDSLIDNGEIKTFSQFSNNEKKNYLIDKNGVSFTPYS